MTAIRNFLRSVAPLSWLMVVASFVTLALAAAISKGLDGSRIANWTSFPWAACGLFLLGLEFLFRADKASQPRYQQLPALFLKKFFVRFGIQLVIGIVAVCWGISHGNTIDATVGLGIRAVAVILAAPLIATLVALPFLKRVPATDI